MMTELPSHIQVQFLRLISLGKPGAAKALYQGFLAKQAQKRRQEQRNNYIAHAQLKRHNLTQFKNTSFMPG